jgi:hypothetical protein
MTDNEPVRTVSEFNRRLDALVESATRHGVDVRGGWVVRPPGGSRDYEALFTEVTDDGDGDRDG